MSDEIRTNERKYEVERQPNHALLLGVGVAALVLALGALGWSYNLQNKLADAQQQNSQLQSNLDATNARLKATSETLGESVGMTQKQLEDKSDAILASEHADTVRLERAQAATNQQVSNVSSNVTAVQTDVGGVKTDVATTKTDLANTQAQLQRAIGDAGVMSGLIATNHDELEQLKHKGDRNYFEFTLTKGAQPTLLASVTLQLKKADTKRSKFTLNVSSDDKLIEKKDKNLDEPVQFYTGKDPVLYELVVNNITKNSVTGYLSTPKSISQ
jgi:chromosome segregation ATPase